jgi:hypothetical protein
MSITITRVGIFRKKVWKMTLPKINELTEAPEIYGTWYGHGLELEKLSFFVVNGEKVSYEEFDKWYKKGMEKLGWEPILTLL